MRKRLRLATGLSFLVSALAAVLVYLVRATSVKQLVYVDISPLPLVHNQVSFPLASYSSKGVLAVTGESVIELFAKTSGGWEPLSLLTVPTGWFEAPFFNIGGYSLQLQDRRVLLGPDVMGMQGSSSEYRSRLRAERYHDFLVGDNKYELIRFAIPTSVEMPGHALFQDGLLWVYNASRDRVEVYSEGKLIAASPELRLSLVWYGKYKRTVFDAGGYDVPSEEMRNLWLTGLVEGRLVGVSLADGEVLWFSEDLARVRRFGPSYRNVDSWSHSWQPALKDGLLLIPYSITSDSFGWATDSLAFAVWELRGSRFTRLRVQMTKPLLHGRGLRPAVVLISRSDGILVLGKTIYKVKLGRR